MFCKITSHGNHAKTNSLITKTTICNLSSSFVEDAVVDDLFMKYS